MSTYLLLFLCFSYYNLVESISKHPIVLIVSYDGFRYNYLQNKEISCERWSRYKGSFPRPWYELLRKTDIRWSVIEHEWLSGVNPVLTSLKHVGTSADYVNNIFLTKTFPNHHSIATGLYSENHGVMGNQVFDPQYGQKLTYSYEFWHYSDDVVPIWIANEMKGGGRHSGIMMWPGNEYNYSGVYPTHQRSWQKEVTWEERVDGVIQWILDPVKPANLVLLYIEQPDKCGHSYGPESPQHLEELKSLDNITKYLMNRLNETNLINHVNIFFISDHGMQSVTKKNIIDLRKFVADEKYYRYENSPVFYIYPKKGQANLVYSALKNASLSGYHFQVYKKNDIPDRWHIKNNRRTPPILAVADPSYVFHDFYLNIAYEEKERNFTAKDNDTFGVHGYDNEAMNMKPYFLAIGPLIKKNYKIEPFETVDLFSLWANMLGFPEYSAKTNGSCHRVCKMLTSEKKSFDNKTKTELNSAITSNELK